MPSRLSKTAKAMQREKTIYLQGFTILGIQIFPSVNLPFGLIDWIQSSHFSLKRNVRYHFLQDYTLSVSDLLRVIDIEFSDRGGVIEI
jgi:hypothetical protein